MNPLFVKVPDGLVGVELIVIACVVLTWATLSISEGWYQYKTYGASLDTFAMNLGCYLVWSFVLKMILGIEITRDIEQNVDLWAFVFVNVGFFFALRAYKSWARGKINGSWYGDH